jgi:predicted amidophosphoribosyltransferase
MKTENVADNNLTKECKTTQGHPWIFNERQGNKISKNCRLICQKYVTDPGSYKFTIHIKRKRNERKTQTKRTKNERTLHTNDTRNERTIHERIIGA